MRKSASREQMEKTAAIVQDAFHDAGVDASIHLGESSNRPHLVLMLDGIGNTIDGYPPDRHPRFNLPPSCRTAEDVAGEVNELRATYDPLRMKRIHPDSPPERFDATVDALGRITNACFTAARMERLTHTADAIGTVFQKLGLEHDVELCVENKRYDAPNLTFRICNIRKDETCEVMPGYQTIEEVAGVMCARSSLYDIEEEKSHWTPGEDGAPEEPEFTQEFEHIRKMYGRIADACDTALRVERNELGLEDACEARLALWEKQEQDEARRDYPEPLNQTGSLHDLPPEEPDGRPDIESMKDRMLASLREVIDDLRASGVSGREIDKALGKVRKELPSLSQEKPQGR